jgi:hypothetical protein
MNRLLPLVLLLPSIGNALQLIDSASATPIVNTAVAIFREIHCAKAPCPPLREGSTTSDGNGVIQTNPDNYLTIEARGYHARSLYYATGSRIELDPIQPGLRRLKLLDKRGAPVANATAQFTTEGSVECRATTNRLGNVFVPEGLLPAWHKGGGGQIAVSGFAPYRYPAPAPEDENFAELLLKIAAEKLSTAPPEDEATFRLTRR